MGNSGDDGTVVDMIRELPDAIIVKILSSLPIRDAVRTLLIPSFGNLWTYVYNLDLDSSQFYICLCSSFCEHKDDDEDKENVFGIGKFRRFVRSVLTNHLGDKINEFRIKFDFQAMGNFTEDEEDQMIMELSRFSAEVDSWIEFALNKDVEILEIDLKECEFSVFGFIDTLPSSALRSGSLTSLKLVKCNVGVCEVNMQALRSLFLEFVDLNDEILRKILAGCPSLESLSILYCSGLNKLNCDSRKLKTLTISPQISGESELRVICPHIASLTISGVIGLLLLENISGLQDILIDACHLFCHIRDDYLKVRKMFESICHVRAVTMQNDLILVLAVLEQRHLFSPSNSWQHLVIQTTLTKCRLPGIRNVLRSSLSLETLCLQIVPGENLSDAKESGMQQHEFDESDYWDSPDQSFQLLHLGESLKSITVTGDVTNHQILPLLKLLLGKAMGLEQLVVKASLDDDSGSVQKWEEFTEKLSGLPRASTRLLISLSLVLIHRAA